MKLFLKIQSYQKPEIIIITSNNGDLQEEQFLKTLECLKLEVSIRNKLIIIP